MEKVVLDTNVFVSSLLSKTGATARVLDRWRAGRYLLVTSPWILEEIKATLQAPRIRAKYSVSSKDLAQLVELLAHEALIVPGESDVRGGVPADPDDERVLACAVDTGASIIVTGDGHLLDLGQFRGISILGVRGFLDRLERPLDAANQP